MTRARLPASHGAHHHRNATKIERAALGDEARLVSARDRAHRGWFTGFATATAHWAGKPMTFLVALAIIAVWGATGPLFGFSDTWQLIINTGTTIITFLMVFIIQNTQNRDTLSLQIKLAELIIAMRGAHNRMATVEDLSEDDLEALHNEYRHRAEKTLESLSRRQAEHEQR